MSKIQRILVVEDDALLLLSLCDDLQDLGYTPVPASCSRTASRLLDDSIDALISDIELGNTPNGLILARLAREHRPNMPIVLVSGGVTPTAEQLPPQVAFYSKPYLVDHLVKSIERQRSILAA